MKQKFHTTLKLFTSSRPALEKRQESLLAREEPLKSYTPGTSLFSIERLNQAITKACANLVDVQNAEGFWVFDLEADTTIPSEYILVQRFLGRQIPPDLKESLARYLRNRQLDDGGWPLYRDGNANLSTSCKTYFALKMLGESPDSPHMVRARELILGLGGAAKVNVFTRITLALFGQIPWHTNPAMPVEIMLLPKWFFFHLQKVSYWSRTVIVPLLILYAKRPVCRLDPGEGIQELFLEPSGTLYHLDHFCGLKMRKNFFVLLDRLLKGINSLMPRRSRERAIRLAEHWTLERMQGAGGLGAIFPAMTDSVMALKVLGYPDDHPDVVRGIKAIDDLLLDCGDEAFCQPCVSPIWDSCLALTALLEAGNPKDQGAIAKSVDWLFGQEIFSRGDWAYRAPKLEPGGWAFQFENAFYPDVDDTPMVLMALLRAGALEKTEYRERITKAVNWVLGMQSSDGGWGAFDIDNSYLYLNDIPFADHGALLDPSTSDLTGRCIALLSMLGYGPEFPPITKAIEFLRREQEDFGAWFGRWGVNYIYGTWSVLAGLRQVGEDMTQGYIRKAVAWLKSCQNPDNGWGETCLSYQDPSLAGKGESTASQTAWALLALLAAGEVNDVSVQRGIHYLLSTRNDQGGWDEELFTGTGFPGVFYLRYHGYSNYFPLWALGVYRRLRTGKVTVQDEVTSKSPIDLPQRK